MTKMFERHAREIIVERWAATAPRSAKVIQRIADIVSMLGLDKTLAWHLKLLCDKESPLSHVEHVAGPEAVRIMLKALRVRNVSAA